MQYKGKELEDIHIENDVVFPSTKAMIVWGENCNPMVDNVFAIKVFPNGTLLVVCLNNERVSYYPHCAEIQPVRTNWDVFCEKYGTEKDWDFQKVTSVDLNCTTCPARKICKKSKIYNKGKIGVNCPDPFIRWAKSEAEEEK
jgi:hypothetical protein